MQIVMLRKNVSTTYLIYCIGLFILLISQASAQFNQTRLRIIDQNQGHFLVRGNLPIINSTFDFPNLYKQLSALTNTTGYRVVVISLLNLLTAKETKSRYIEQNYFDKNGEAIYNQNTHLYQSHPIYGAMWSPAQYSVFLRKIATDLYDQATLDNIPALMENIESRMRSPKNTIVYVHCSQGIDRAGYVAGAYLMKNKGHSLRQAMQRNFDTIAGFRAHMHFNSFNGLQWYCLYLGRSEEQCQIHNIYLNKAQFFNKILNSTVQQNEEKKAKQKNKEKTQQKKQKNDNEQ